MVINKDIYSLEFWAQEQYLRNTDGSLNIGQLQNSWGSQAKTKFLAQLQEAGYSELPKPALLGESSPMSMEQFLEIYEFGTPVREYIIKAAQMGFTLERQTLFGWVKSMRPDKVDYGRNYSQVNIG